MKKTYQFVSWIPKPKMQEELVATLRLQLAVNRINWYINIRINIIYNVFFNSPTDYLSCDRLWSKFLIPRLLRRMIEKTVCIVYQIWKWKLCIVKGSPYPSFQAYTFGNVITIVTKPKSRKLGKTVDYEYFNFIQKCSSLTYSHPKCCSSRVADSDTWY